MTKQENRIKAFAYNMHLHFFSQEDMHSTLFDFLIKKYFVMHRPLSNFDLQEYLQVF